MNTEKLRLSRNSWDTYQKLFLNFADDYEVNKRIAVDYVDAWNYRELHYELKNLARLAREALERLKAYEQEGEKENG